jgi:hypothetical protein
VIGASLVEFTASSCGLYIDTVVIAELASSFEFGYTTHCEIISLATIEERAPPLVLSQG